MSVGCRKGQGMSILGGGTVYEKVWKKEGIGTLDTKKGGQCGETGEGRARSGQGMRDRGLVMWTCTLG